jgi:hypothetical protein
MSCAPASRESKTMTAKNARTTTAIVRIFGYGLSLTTLSNK